MSLQRNEIIRHVNPISERRAQPQRETTLVASKIMIIILFAGAILAIAGFIIFALRTMGF
jgi:hypothetical protein